MVSPVKVNARVGSGRPVTGDGSFPSSEGVVVATWDEMCTATVDVAGTISVQVQSLSTGGAWTNYGTACTADCEVAVTGPRDRLRFTAASCSNCSATTVGLTCRRSGAAETVLPPWKWR